MNNKQFIELKTLLLDIEILRVKNHIADMEYKLKNTNCDNKYTMANAKAGLRRGQHDLKTFEELKEKYLEETKGDSGWKNY